MDSIERSVERVIEAMHENLGENFTVDDMARIAIFSKFHFSRVFRDTTGVSPGRFLSALRLQAAKHLLVSTSLSVADISIQVGYASVGTFSSRFKSSVGVAPSVYRATGGVTPRRQPPSTGGGKRSSTVRGELRPGENGPGGPAFVGLFPDVIPQGRPAQCTILPRPGRFVLENAPEGMWHVLAYSFGPDRHDGADVRRGAASAPSIGGYGPIVIGPDTATVEANVQLRSARPLDPPVLLAPLDADAAVLNAIAS
ncbi:MULTISPECIES: helix-turn-helix domain-containing protein [Thermomonosporaceae]|uniref:helix-turn-helix domain-containing protein n=1 Tax=Thermomonosporaceae TaxID=2012 RepID=UPI00255B2CF5|nr:MULTISPECIES: AraC family transcriptional regulator [Thermomonosporaceae]MDL4777362.1 AraC family transcriptional regulator [Actinomadura xylanilytica]